MILCVTVAVLIKLQHISLRRICFTSGAVIIFTGLFSVAFLRSYLQGFRWLGMGFITVGLVIVGVSDIIFGENSKRDINGIITGFVHYLKKKRLAKL